MTKTIDFPQFAGVRCLMMPYIQGDPASVPNEYQAYSNILSSVYIKRGDIGFLTIDESPVRAGSPHRGYRARCLRALHTEAGQYPNRSYRWGGGWGSSHKVTLDADAQILLANNLDGSCAVWPNPVNETSLDGDIGHLADQYPYESATFMKAGEVRQIGILTPHESIPVQRDFNRQFLRVISSDVHGREDYFTINPILGELWPTIS